MNFYIESNFQSYQGELIPADWTTVKIMDVASVKEGIYGRRSDNGKILQLKADSIRDNGKMNNDAFAKITLDRAIDAYLVKAGDVLLNNRNSAKLVGKSAIFQDGFSECVFGNLLTRIRLSSKEIIPEWLVFRLMQLHTTGFLMAISTRAVNQALLKKGTVEKIWIPVPQVTEQQRIVQVLAVVDSALELADRLIAKTGRLKKGLMQQLLTHGIGHTEYKQTPIGQLPNDWKVMKIGDVSSHVGSGLTPRGGSNTYLDKGIPLIRSQNVLTNKLDLSDVAFISLETHKFMQRSTIFSGDVLLNITGASIGRVTVVPASIKEANVNQHVCRIRFLSQILPEFAAYYLSSADGQYQIMSFQSGATRQGLNYQQVRAIQLPCPSLEEQKKIAEIMSTIDSKIDAEIKEKLTLERVKQALMDLLLTGKVRIRVD